MNYNLGKLEKITNLREVWKNEATDFTKWLAKENNIKLLSEELGFNITVDETEASTGRYNVDIKAHEEETDKTISSLIETINELKQEINNLKSLLG